MPYQTSSNKYGSGGSGFSSSFGGASGPLSSLLSGRYDYSGRSPIFSGSPYGGGYTSSPFGGGYGGFGSGGFLGASSYSSGSSKFNSLATISEHSVLPSQTSAASATARRLPRGYVPASLLPATYTPNSVSSYKKPAVFDTENIDVTSPRKPSVKTTATPGDINREKAFGTIKRGRTVIRIRTQNLKDNPYLTEEEQKARAEERKKEKEKENLAKKLRDELRNELADLRKPWGAGGKKAAGDKFRERFMIQSKKKKCSGYQRPSLSDIRSEQDLLQKELQQRLSLIESADMGQDAVRNIDLEYEAEMVEQVKEKISHLEKKIQRRYSRALKRASSSTTDEESSTEDDNPERKDTMKLKKSSSRGTLKAHHHHHHHHHQKSNPTTPEIDEEDGRKSPVLKRKATQKFFFPAAAEECSAVQPEIVDLDAIVQLDAYEKNIMAHRATARKMSHQNVKYIQPRKSSITDETLDLASLEAAVQQVAKTEELITEVVVPPPLIGENEEVAQNLGQIKDADDGKAKKKVVKYVKKRKTGVINAPSIPLVLDAGPKGPFSSVILQQEPKQDDKMPALEDKLEKVNPIKIQDKPQPKIIQEPAKLVSTPQPLNGMKPTEVIKIEESIKTHPITQERNKKSDTDTKPIVTKQPTEEVVEDITQQTPAEKPKPKPGFKNERSVFLDKVLPPKVTPYSKLQQVGKTSSLESDMKFISSLKDIAKPEEKKFQKRDEVMLEFIKKLEPVSNLKSLDIETQREYERQKTIMDKMRLAVNAPNQLEKVLKAEIPTPIPAMTECTSNEIPSKPSESNNDKPQSKPIEPTETLQKVVQNKKLVTPPQSPKGFKLPQKKEQKQFTFEKQDVEMLKGKSKSNENSPKDIQVSPKSSPIPLSSPNDVKKTGELSKVPEVKGKKKVESLVEAAVTPLKKPSDVPPTAVVAEVNIKPEVKPLEEINANTIFPPVSELSKPIQKEVMIERPVVKCKSEEPITAKVEKPEVMPEKSPLVPSTPENKSDLPPIKSKSNDSVVPIANVSTQKQQPSPIKSKSDDAVVVPQGKAANQKQVTPPTPKNLEKVVKPLQKGKSEDAVTVVQEKSKLSDQIPKKVLATSPLPEKKAQEQPKQVIPPKPKVEKAIVKPPVKSKSDDTMVPSSDKVATNIEVKAPSPTPLQSEAVSKQNDVSPPQPIAEAIVVAKSKSDDTIVTSSNKAESHEKPVQTPVDTKKSEIEVKPQTPPPPKPKLGTNVVKVPAKSETDASVIDADIPLPEKSVSPTPKIQKDPALKPKRLTPTKPKTEIKAPVKSKSDESVEKSKEHPITPSLDQQEPSTSASPSPTKPKKSKEKKAAPPKPEVKVAKKLNKKPSPKVKDSSPSSQSPSPSSEPLQTEMAEKPDHGITHHLPSKSRLENKPERDNKNDSYLIPNDEAGQPSAEILPKTEEDEEDEAEEPKSSSGSSGGSVSSTASSTLTAKTGSTCSSGSTSGSAGSRSRRIPSPTLDDDSDEGSVSLEKICPAKTRPKYRKYEVDDFQFLKVLGKGSFGKVLLAELKDSDSYFAIKCLKKDVVLEDDDVECTMIERKVLLMGSKHPYLCHLFCTFQTESHLFFVMEYLNGGDLMFHIQQSGKFSEERARFYGAEIVSGLKFLHKKGVMYRDLKLDNILLDYEGHIRIADFGMCKLQIYLDRTADTFCGTPDYMSPEIIKGLKYNQCVDWWAFGVLLYEMLVGQSPFSGCDEDELFWSICNEQPRYPRFLSKESLWVLERLLEKDASRRLGMASCAYGDVKNQIFFNSIDWDKLEKKELEPPYRPKLKHPLDVQYFDTTFTKEVARLTQVDKTILQSMDQSQFDGFSYTNPHTTD